MAAGLGRSDDGLSKLDSKAEMSFAGKRARVAIVETPEAVYLSFYPRKEDDESWPGSPLNAARVPGFPIGAWRAGDHAGVRAWVDERGWLD